MKEFYETHDGQKLTRDQYNEYMNKLAQDYDPGAELSEEEQAYRRGFRQGFHAAVLHDADEEDVRKVGYWAKNNELTAPPYTPFAGRSMHGMEKQFIA